MVTTNSQGHSSKICGTLHTLGNAKHYVETPIYTMVRFSAHNYIPQNVPASSLVLVPDSHTQRERGVWYRYSKPLWATACTEDSLKVLSRRCYINNQDTLSPHLARCEVLHNAQPPNHPRLRNSAEYKIGVSATALTSVHLLNQGPEGVLIPMKGLINSLPPIALVCAQ